MRGGRKHLKMKRACEEQELTLQDGQSIMQVVSLRGSNLIEVMDGGGHKSLAIFPAKFHKTMWIKRGSFVVVDDSGKDKALESGNKVASIVSQLLFYEQVRLLQTSSHWPDIFKTAIRQEDSDKHPSHRSPPEMLEEADSSGEDGLPPLQANLNRVRPCELPSDTESESDPDS
ncbi:hypothetical protein Sjap_014383 [Stephania japonica]|uniref:S1-like domain-containing protein n=1 Tax=Stephania japonica TaxID=461633 RepID=A0AAP0P279_9MAGN